MKYVLFLFLISATLFSCDNLNCEDEDLVGVYTGTQTCDSDSVQTSYEIFIEDNEVFLRESGGSRLEIITDGCNFTIPAQTSLTATISGSGSIAGDDLDVSITRVELLSSDAQNCAFEGDK